MLDFGRFSVAKLITPHSFQHRNLCLDPNKLKKWEFARDIFTVGMVQIPTTCSSAPYCSLKKERKALSSLGKINYLSKSLSKSSKVLAPPMASFISPEFFFFWEIGLDINGIVHMNA